MKHPKDRGDRIRKKRNAQHRELFTKGLFRPKVEADKRREILERAALDEEDQYEADEI